MQIIRELEPLRAAVGQIRRGSGRIALVPTMGALHAGHMALVEQARAVADHVVASIFVNPMQFGANEDLGRYPRREAQDAAMLEAAGCAILWAPGVDTIYPPGFATTISVAGVSEGLCGGARPGHFDGVATVVAKLFNQVRPDVALFGEKDFQQLAVIRRMARDLDLELEIIGVPTVREADGLALSSRNLYLSPEDRASAAVLPRLLEAGAEELALGAAAAPVLARISEALTRGGFQSVDYVELRDALTLTRMDHAERPGRLLAAARIGSTRLIDNVPVPAATSSPPH